MVQRSKQYPIKQNLRIKSNPLLYTSDLIFTGLGLSFNSAFLERISRTAIDIIINDWACGIFSPIIAVSAFAQAMKQITSKHIYQVIINKVEIDLRDDDEFLSRRVTNVVPPFKRPIYSPVLLIDSNTYVHRYYCIVGINDNIISITQGKGAAVKNITREEAVDKFIQIDGDYDDTLLAYSYSIRKMKKK